MMIDEVFHLLEGYRDDVERLAPPLELDEIVAARIGAGSVRPLVDRRSQRWPPWATVVAALVAASVLGGIALLLTRDDRGSGVVVADAGTAASVTPTIEAPPRVVFTLSAAPDVEPIWVSTVIGDFEFIELQFPPGHSFYELTATPHGPVAISDSTLWWSTDYETWEGVPIFLEGGRVAVVGDDIVAYGERGAARFVWDGSGWVHQTQLDLIGEVDQIVFGPRGAVALRHDTIYYSSDSLRFTEAERGPSKEVFVAVPWVPEEDRDFEDCRATFGATFSRINAVLATDAGFVASTSAWPPEGLICEPLLWFSADGNTWDLVSHDSPFGEMASFRAHDFPGSSISLWEIAERDGRFVTSGEVGGQGIAEAQVAVWVSDDGLAWQRADTHDGFGTVIAGELGWMRIGAEEARYPAMWFSIDGLTWDGPYDLPQPLGGLLPGWRLPRPVVGSDAIFGVGGEDVVLVVGRLQD
jgi:hypothetical protein